MPTLRHDDVTISYETTGSGPPLVFLHGGWSNSDTWRPQVERFAGDHRVVTADTRGHGKTGETDRSRYSIGLFADDLEALLDHLDVERPVLCGLSLGGMVVQEFLARHPDRAAGAVIAGPVQSMPPIDLPAGVKPFLSPMPMLSVSLSMLGSRATFDGLLRSIRPANGGPWLAADPAVRERAREAVGDVSPAEFRKIFRALYEYEPPDLSHVQTPTLVLYGDREFPLVKRQGESIAAAVVRGEAREIPGAGHLVNEDNPGAFNAALAEFLADPAVRPSAVVG